MIQLKDLCQKASSNIAQKDLEGHEGQYPIYGASGLIGYVDFYKQENPYVAVVKDGAGIGRVMCLPEKSSVIGTMQYILPNEGVNVHYLAFAMEHKIFFRRNDTTYLFQGLLHREITEELRSGAKTNFNNSKQSDGAYFSPQTTAFQVGRADKGTVCGDVWRL